MSSNQDFANFVIDQIEDAGEITVRKMFGEFAIYSDGKIFGLICDNKLFVKPTDAGREFIGDDLEEGIPFPGAKPKFLIESKLEDREWLSKLVRISLPELPMQKKRKSKKKK